jgi:hypothetical protein
MSSAVLRLDYTKMTSPDNSSFSSAHFNASIRDSIKLDHLKSALEVVCHASLLHPKISKSEYSIYVIEQPLLQPPLLVCHVYGKFPTECYASRPHTARVTVDYQPRTTLMLCHDPQIRQIWTPLNIFGTNLLDTSTNANPHLNDWANSEKRCNMDDKGYHRSE